MYLKSIRRQFIDDSLVIHARPHQILLRETSNTSTSTPPTNARKEAPKFPSPHKNT